MGHHARIDDMLRASDPFAILGVSPGVNLDDLTRAFRMLARVTHPDKGGDAERFKAVTEAYDAARRIVTRADGMVGSRASEPRERYDWRRGRSSFETRGEGPGGRRGEPNRCEDDDTRVSRDAARRRGSRGAVGHRAMTRRADRVAGDAEDATARCGPYSSCSSSEDDSSENDSSENAEPERYAVQRPATVLTRRAAPDGRTPPVVSVACSPDGVVAAACLEAGVRLWDAAKGALLAEHVLASAAEHEARPERKADIGNGDATEGKKKKPTPRASDAWWALDGRSLVVAYDEGSVLFWGDLLMDASSIASCPSGGDGRGKPTNHKSAKNALDASSPVSLRGHRRRVVASAWFADPTNIAAAAVLVTASLDSTARVWRFSTGDDIRFPGNARTERNSFSAAAAATETRGTRSRRLLSCTILPGDNAHGGGAGMTCCSVTADGAFLATGDSDGVFSVWAFHETAPFVFLAQRVRWAGDASSRSDDAVLKCAFVDSCSAAGAGESGSRTGSRVGRDKDGYRLVTAHYSRDTDRSRLLVWRVGRERPAAEKRPARPARSARGSARVAADAADAADAAVRPPFGSSATPADDTRVTFVAEDRAFRDHCEIRGYEQCVPAGGSAWRGRVSDVAVSDGAAPGAAPKIAACGAAGWVTVVGAASGHRDAPASFETLYTVENATCGARRARFLSRPAESRDEDGAEDEDDFALVTVAGEDGFIVARDAEDGEEMARFAVDTERGAPARVWSLSGFASKDADARFLVAGTADGDVACWKVPAELFRRGTDETGG